MYIIKTIIFFIIDVIVIMKIMLVKKQKKIKG